MWYNIRIIMNMPIVGLSSGTLLSPFLFLMLSITSNAQSLPVADHAAAIDSLMPMYDSTNAPGASVAVIKDGVVIFQKGYGYADLATRRRITPATNFRLASMTKQFTAMCIMILKEQGKLSYADPITTFFPDFPAFGRKITVRNLLTHTSGLLDYESLIHDSQTVQIMDKGVLALIMKTDSTYFPPGSKYLYSNTGYALLSLIVEKASGEPFAEFLRKRIFSALGMKSTLAFIQGKAEVPERAYGYSRTDSGFVFTDQSVTSAVLGDGGIYSNTEDLARWDRSLYTNALVPKTDLDEAFADAALNDGTPIEYGYGWHTEIFLGLRHPFHSGETRGFRNVILRFPTQQLSVIILTNRNDGKPIEIAKKIAELYLVRIQH
jgi:CubicO group peptidase (beta-lactamase class C family)